ncbi:MAG TPA: hypothetical protein VFU13_11340 [Steroidobacteraceae bacterium]|nr:hypothetical protein [Steroidobacteraceae bacterium]
MEAVTLPGKAPSAPRDVHGAWQFFYTEDDAVLDGGRSHLSVTIVLMLRDDDTYDLLYNARWGGVAIGVGSRDVVVRESGTYSLSGEVLLLEAATTNHSEMENNTAVRQQAIPNENHVLLAHVEKKRLHVVGRCAKYQVDPVCRLAPNVWYSLTSELGRRWFKE